MTIILNITKFYFRTLTVTVIVLNQFQNAKLEHFPIMQSLLCLCGLRNIYSNISVLLIWVQQCKQQLNRSEKCTKSKILYNLRCLQGFPHRTIFSNQFFSSILRHLFGNFKAAVVQTFYPPSTKAFKLHIVELHEFSVLCNKLFLQIYERNQCKRLVEDMSGGIFAFSFLNDGSQPLHVHQVKRFPVHDFLKTCQTSKTNNRVPHGLQT